MLVNIYLGNPELSLKNINVFHLPNKQFYLIIISQIQELKKVIFSSKIPFSLAFDIVVFVIVFLYVIYMQILQVYTIVM